MANAGSGLRGTFMSPDLLAAVPGPLDEEEVTGSDLEVTFLLPGLLTARLGPIPEPGDGQK